MDEPVVAHDYQWFGHVDQWELGFNPEVSADFHVTTTTNPEVHLVSIPMCPDLIRYEYCGQADNLRGHIVRGFLWLLDKIMPVQS